MVEGSEQVRSKLGNPNIAEEGKPYQWRPGQSGNPGGKHKDPGITPLQIEMMGKVCPYDAKGRTWREWLAERGLLQVAEKPQAVKDYKDRVEGAVAEQVEIQLIKSIVKDYGNAV